MDEAIAQWSRRLGSDVPVLATSSATGQGLDELAGVLLRAVPSAAPAPAAEPLPGVDGLAEHQVFRPAARRGFRVERRGDHAFRVVGEGIERLMLRFDVDNEDAMAYVEGRLRRIGVLRALEAQGFAPGDEIEIGGIAFELDPSEAD